MVTMSKPIQQRFSFLFKPLLITASLILISFCLMAQESPSKIKKDLLIEDIRQLVEILEASHPDPYIRGGGKIAFHRRFQETMLKIPEDGLSQKDFFSYLLPLVASVKDGHTFLLPPWPVQSNTGLPFGLNIVEESLYIEKVFNYDHKHFIGAKLQAVNNLPLSELLNRLKSLIGWDNEYQLLTYLCRFLDDRTLLSLLLPELDLTRPLKIDISLPSGQKKILFVQLLDKKEAAPIEAPSQITIPSTTKIDFAYDFLDPKKEICLLRIDGMFGFRENFEFFRGLGANWFVGQAAQVYNRIYQQKPPENIDELIAAIPSATETFLAMVQEMKKAGTKKLLVDLRKNSGGNSLMANILVYFLFDQEQVRQVSSTYSVKKYSNLYFAVYQNDSLEKVNQGKKIRLSMTDYDFSDDPYLKSRLTDRQDLELERENYLKMVKTFYAEYQNGRHKNYYRPQEIIIISSPWTYSSGYTLMSMFYKLGSKIVGVPSGQSGNCFGDTLTFQLKNSGLRGFVSHKLFLDFPDNPELGYMLRPHRELTYKDLIRCQFDPNASILLALGKL